MIIWGGITNTADQRLTSTGVAYNPVTRRWRTLPAAPLAARDGAASVWTGTELIIWGGTLNANPDVPVRDARDGAAYNPVTNRWRRLPPSPLSARTGSQALWTGKQVVVVGGVPSANVSTAAPGSGAQLRSYRGASNQAAAYDPRTDRWSSLADLPVPNGEKLDELDAIWTGSELLEWWQWDHITDASSRDFGFTGGIALYAYSAEHNTWRRTALPEDLNCVGSAAPVMNDNHVLFPASRFEPPYAVSEPMPIGLRGCQYGPSTREYNQIAHGRLDDTGGPTIWSGKALVRVNLTTTISGGQDGMVKIGQADAWNPATDSWPELPDAPTEGRYQATAAVWTGHELILLVASPQVDNGAVQGLQLVPRSN